MVRAVADPKRRNTLPSGVLPTGRHSRIQPRTPQGEATATSTGVTRRLQSQESRTIHARMLVEELMLCDRPQATAPIIRRLFPFGRLALDALAKQFPGPLWFDRLRPHKRMPKPEEISAISSALAAFDADAVPYLHGLLKNRDADVRCYAAMICAEVHHIDLMQALLTTAVDPDPQCRKVSLHVLSGYRTHQAWTLATSTLRGWAASQTESPRVRKLVVSALTQLRDEASVQLFVDLLTNEDRGLATASRVGLRVLVAHDFAFSRAPWVRLLAAFGTKSRVEWLIEGLGDARPEIRSVAIRELRRIAPAMGEPSHNASKRDISAVQARYRSWWRQKQAFRTVYPRSP